MFRQKEKKKEENCKKVNNINDNLFDYLNIKIYLQSYLKNLINYFSILISNSIFINFILLIKLKII